MFKQLPSSTAALYLQHQQSEWQRLCGTLISHWTTGDRLTSSSHKNILSAHRKKKTFPMMWLLFLKRVCFSCFLSHEAKPPWKVSTLSHELWVHHYGQNLQDSRARHRHWVPPCLRLRKENPGCYHRFDYHTWTRRQDPAQQMGLRAWLLPGSLREGRVMPSHPPGLGYSQ